MFPASGQACLRAQEISELLKGLESPRAYVTDPQVSRLPYNEPEAAGRGGMGVGYSGQGLSELFLSGGHLPWNDMLCVVCHKT